MVSYLLQIYATNNIIAEAEAAKFRYIHLSTMSPALNAEAVAKSLRYGDLYEENVVKEVFIEDLHQSVRHCMRSYYSTHAKSAFHDLARHAMSLRVLQMRNDELGNKETGRRQNAEDRRGGR